MLEHETISQAIKAERVYGRIASVNLLFYADGLVIRRTG